MAQTKVKEGLIDATLGGGVSWDSTVKTAAFTAVAGEGYFVNTTSAAITVTLPSSPSAGDEVTIVDYYGTSSTNNITITSADKINTSTSDVFINYIRGAVSMVYVDATQGWVAYNAANESSRALKSNIVTDFLVVAGGGGAGYDVGGGGGAGGLRTSYGSTSGGGASAESSLSLSYNTSYTLTIGGGGASGTTTNDRGDNGNNSSISGSDITTITSTGGGGGGSYPDSGSGLDGGSGGGAGDTASAGGSGTANQGFDGGSSSSSNYGSGGGGGAGGAGANGVQNTVVDGGAPLAVSITGTSVNYAGGGYGNTDGGAVYSTGYNKSNTQLGTYGFGANGTGAPNANSEGGNSGVIILRYPSTESLSIGAGLTSSTIIVGNDKVSTFTAGTGTITFT